MVGIRDAEIQNPRFAVRRTSGYSPGPSLDDLRSGATLLRGHSGASVRELQSLLNALGAEPPLEVDGLFGPKTEAALLGRERAMGLEPRGALSAPLLSLLELAGRIDGADGGGQVPVDLAVERALRGLGENGRRQRRAPRFGERAPAGSMSAGQLARSDDQRLARGRARAPNPRGTSPDVQVPGGGRTPNGPGGASSDGQVRVRAVDPAPGQNAPDAELASIQRATMDSARGELAAGVRDNGANRGARVDQYARDGRMPVGGAWCGYFTGFNYSEAARAAGGTFTENIRFHSMQKARSYFEYRTYTNASSAENARLDNLRAEHQAQGSTRRWMVLSGSAGERHATTHNRPHEVFEPSNLPIREGDTALFSRGHVGLVESYDRASGQLVTIEGNASGGRVKRNTYNLNDAADRARFEGFGRPARGDFDLPGGIPAGDAPANDGGEPGANGVASDEATRVAGARANGGEPGASGGASDEAARAAGATANGVEPGSSGGGSDEATLAEEARANGGASGTGGTNPPASNVDASEGAPSDATRSDPDGAGAARTGATLALPPRSSDALTGSEFLARAQGLSRPEREAAILREIERGNVPDFARQMREIPVSSTGPDGRSHTGTLRVMPDYLAIGSNDDFVRIPMTPQTAQRIADLTGTSLPTRKIVNDVYQNAEVRLTPQPLKAGAQMMSNDYYGRHQALVQGQLTDRDAAPGALVAGHKKDVVIGNRQSAHPDRVAIYGWHQPNGKPIQPLSTIHERTYADYSHGVRLVGGTMIVDGQERALADVLRDPNLAGLVSDEGVVRDPRVPR